MNNKLNLSKNPLLRTIKELVVITLGVIIYVFAWVGIIMPADGVGGGASGFALLIYYATGGEEGGIPIGVTFLAFNAILLVAAIIMLGAKFGIKTIYTIILVSFVMTAMQSWLPDNLLGLANDKLLSAILGGAVCGVGVSLILMEGGSSGGSDIIAMIINKYRNISYGRIVTAVDYIIIGCSYFIFKDLATIIYGFVLTAALGITADMMLAGNKQSAQIFIMSQRYEEIANLITGDMHRGVTVIDGIGWYTKQPSKVIMVVVRRNEATYLLSRIKSLDSQAFITMGSVMGVYGAGFDTFRK